MGGWTEIASLQRSIKCTKFDRFDSPNLTQGGFDDENQQKMDVTPIQPSVLIETLPPKSRTMQTIQEPSPTLAGTPNQIGKGISTLCGLQDDKG